MEKSAALTSSRQCWVPLCKQALSNETELFPLPENPQFREIWLALAGKSITLQDEQIYFCSDHFPPDEVRTRQTDIKQLPLRNILQQICQLCLSITDSSISKESVYVLSKNISTEMPACIEELLPYFSPSNPEPLHKIVDFCIPGLDIQCNPPPLVCKSCFVNIWLFYIYKVSALEVEESFKADIPIEDYSKMVLCRSCPVSSGTNFIHVEEESSKGQLLKNIFMGDKTEMDLLPLRVCKNCFEIITRLDLFYQTCQTAEKKNKAHNEMERKLAERRNKLDDFIKISQNRKQDICKFFDDSCRKKKNQEQTTLSLVAKSTDSTNNQVEDHNSTNKIVSSKCDSSDSKDLHPCESTSKCHSSTSSEVGNSNVHKEVTKKAKITIKKNRLLRAMIREFESLQNEKVLVRNPIDVLFERLMKKEFSKYSLKDIKRIWSNMVSLRYAHNKSGLTDEDKLLIELQNNLRAYKTSRTSLFYPCYYKISPNNTKNKLDEHLPSATNTSTNTNNIQELNNVENSNQTSSQSTRRKHQSRWKQKDFSDLFNVIEKEYNAILENKGTVPTNCWKVILDTIIEKNLFRTSNEANVHYVWQRIRQVAVAHKEQGKLTEFDKRVLNFLEKHKNMKSQQYTASLPETRHKYVGACSHSGIESTGNSSMPAKRFKASKQKPMTEIMETNLYNAERLGFADEDRTDLNNKAETSADNKDKASNEEDVDSDATEIDDDSFINMGGHISLNELESEMENASLPQHQT